MRKLKLVFSVIVILMFGVVFSKVAIQQLKETKQSNAMAPTTWADVKDFGAKGDSTTNDRAAIQAAVDSLGNGGTVYFPNGTYIVDDAIMVKRGIHFVGAGGHSYGSVQIRLDAPTAPRPPEGTAVFMVSPNTGAPIDGISWENLEIAHNYPELGMTDREYSTGIMFVGDVVNGPIYDVEIRRVTIRDFGRGVWIYDRLGHLGTGDNRWWMVDRVDFWHVLFAQNTIGLEINAGNATNIDLHGVQFAMAGQDSGMAWGVSAPLAGMVALDGVNFTCASGCPNGWGLHATSLQHLKADHVFTEGPKAFWADFAPGGQLYDFVWSVTDSQLNDSMINGSITYNSSGNWYNGDVVFGSNAGDASIYSSGDRFSAGHKFNLSAATNAYVKVYNEKNYLNSQGDASPKEVQSVALRKGSPTPIISYKDKPNGLYRVSVYAWMSPGITSTEYATINLKFNDPAGAKTLVLANKQIIKQSEPFNTQRIIHSGLIYGDKQGIRLEGYTTNGLPVNVTATVEAIAPDYRQ